MNRQLVKLGLVSLSLLLGLAACTRDSDDDGLDNSREEKLGTNPDVADSDHDGLSDGKELRFGSDPLTADSDGDGLTDGDEFTAGSDPNGGACGSGIELSSPDFSARLMTSAVATTMSTPARITAAGMRNSLSCRERPSSSPGGTAPPRRPALRYP